VFFIHRRIEPAAAGSDSRANEKTRPAQQVHPQSGEQETMRCNPADLLQHLQRPGQKILGRNPSGQAGQGGAQRFGLPLGSSYPEPATLIRHVGLKASLGRPTPNQKTTIQTPKAYVSWHLICKS